MIVHLSNLLHSLIHLTVLSIVVVARDNCDTLLIYLSFYRLLQSIKRQMFCPSTEILSFHAFLGPGYARSSCTIVNLMPCCHALYTNLAICTKDLGHLSDDGFLSFRERRGSVVKCMT